MNAGTIPTGMKASAMTRTKNVRVERRDGGASISGWVLAYSR
jgi:hypothetical protein